MIITDLQLRAGIDPNTELTEEAIRQQISERDLVRIYEMSKDRNVYQNMATSMFPTIHGKERGFLWCWHLVRISRFFDSFFPNMNVFYSP